MTQRTVALVCPTFHEAMLLLEELNHKTSDYPLERTTADYYETTLSEFNFCALVTVGIGLAQAEQGLLSFLKKNPQIKEVILTGFAGGLLKTAAAGDVVIPKSIISLQGSLQPDLKLVHQLAQSSVRAHLAKMMCSAQVVSSPVDKAAMFAATFAEAVDMESYVVGKVCQNIGLSWACVKTILDTADESLSSEWSEVIDVFGRVQWKSLLKKGVAHPGMWKEAMRMRPKLLKKHLAEQTACLTSWLRSRAQKGGFKSSDNATDQKVSQLS